VFPSNMNLPVFVVVGFVSMLTFLLLVPIPVAPALVAAVNDALHSELSVLPLTPDRILKQLEASQDNG